MTHIKRLIALALLLPLAGHAQDTWGGVDKRQHFGASAGLGVLTSALAGSGPRAFGVCVAVGAAKELADKAGSGEASARDLVADAIGCAAGVGFGRVVTRYSREGGVQVVYRVEF